MAASFLVRQNPECTQRDEAEPHALTPPSTWASVASRTCTAPSQNPKANRRWCVASPKHACASLKAVNPFLKYNKTTMAARKSELLNNRSSRCPDSEHLKYRQPRPPVSDQPRALPPSPPLRTGDRLPAVQAPPPRPCQHLLWRPKAGFACSLLPTFPVNDASDKGLIRFGFNYLARLSHRFSKDVTFCPLALRYIPSQVSQLQGTKDGFWLITGTQVTAN